MLLKNQLDWMRIVDVKPFSTFESFSFLLIQTLDDPVGDLYGLSKKTKTSSKLGH